MASNLTPEQLDAARAAMRAELGAARFDELPMEDGEGGGGHRSRSYHHPPVPNTSLRAPSTNSKWAEAIARGAFEDDDAAAVRGMDSMADGNLARLRRAHDTAHDFVTQNYTEKSLPRDRQGHVPPRANFRTAGRSARFQPVIKHSSDGPIDIEATLSGNSRAPPRERRPPAAGPESLHASQLRHALADRRPPVTGSPQPMDPVPVPAKARTSPRPAATSAAHVTQEASTTQMRVVLPDGADIVLKIPATIKSTALSNKKSCHGHIVLISGPHPSEDMIVFSFEDSDVADVRHPISEYTDHMTQEQGVMLLFTIDGGIKMFYAAVFGGLHDRETLIESLRELVDRPKKRHQDASTAPVAAGEGSVAATKPTIVTRTPQPTDKAESQGPGRRSQAPKSAAVITTQLTHLVARPIEPVVQPTPMVQPTPVVQPATMVHTSPVVQTVPVAQSPPLLKSTLVVGQAPVAQPAPVAKPASVAKAASEAEQISPPVKQNQVESAAQAQPGSAASFGILITTDLIDDMMHWVWDTSKHMQDCTPDFGFDMIRTIIRGTAGAILKRKFPDFEGLSSSTRAQIVETECRPTLERRFLQQLARDLALVDELEGQDVGKETERTAKVEPQPVSAQKKLEAPQAPQKSNSSSVYNINELVALRDTATKPPQWVGEMIHQATRDGFVHRGEQQQRRDGPPSDPIQWDEQTMPSVDEQVEQISTNMTESLYPSKTSAPSQTRAVQTAPTSDDGFADFLSGKSAPREVFSVKQASLSKSRWNNYSTNNATSSYSQQLNGLFEDN